MDILPGVPFVHPLKILKNPRFSVFRRYKKGTPGSNGLRPYQASMMELFAKIVTASSRCLFSQKVPSQMFHRVLNMSLDMLKNDVI